MEEIDISEVLLYFKSKVALIIGIALLIVILGNLYAMFLRVPVYKSSSTIVIASNDTNSANMQADITVNQKLVGPYKEIVKSRSVVEQVIKSLSGKKIISNIQVLPNKEKLVYEYNKLAEMINVVRIYRDLPLSSNILVEAVQNTEVLKISVLDKNAEQAKKITSMLSEVFKEEVMEIYNLKNVKVLDSASTPTGADNVNFVKDEIIYFGLGMIASFMLVFIMFYFDKNIRSVEQVESRLGLPILGTIPVYGGKK